MGLVVLVGAGPAGAELLSRAGSQWLALCEVVVYDRLVGTDLLDLVPPAAERIYVGKELGAPRRAQGDIERLLADRARSGKLVVRLKGGDPFVFGRGGEEAEALRAAGVPYRIVPGITAALAAGAYAGIPLTHRQHASSVAFVTAREDPEKPEATHDWRALARVDTLVVYMGVAALEATCERLLAAGRTGETPAAAVERAGSPGQRVIDGTLASLPARAREAGLKAPAVLIVGDVAGLRERLAWFERLPLAGRTVLVTRPRGQAGELAARLCVQGAGVLHAPAIEISPPTSWADLDAALVDLSRFDWLGLTSANGVTAVFERLAAAGRDARALADVRLAVIGPATRDALAARGIRADLTAEPHTTAALAEALVEAGIAGRRVLLARADIAPPELAERLRAAGAEVVEATAYRTLRVAALPEDATEALRAGRVNWVTFTSASCVTHLAALARQARVDLSRAKLAAIGPVTAKALRAEGLEPTVIADDHTAAGLAAAIVATAS